MRPWTRRWSQFDATTCRKRWTYKWNATGHAISPTNRGVAIKDGILVRGTPDGNLIALDMDKGRLLWSRQIADSQAGQYLSMPPLIFEDLVLYGPAGADFGPKKLGRCVQADDGRAGMALQSDPG